MSKSFKIARKPGQQLAESAPGLGGEVPTPQKRAGRARAAESASVTQPSSSTGSILTTRKTIEVPEEYFYQVKMRALERHMLEKEMWTEILSEYFANHP